MNTTYRSSSLMFFRSAIQTKFFLDYNTEQKRFVRWIFPDAMPSRHGKQKSIRKGHAKFIVDAIHKRLRTKKHKKRIRNTNRILPVGGLRRAVVKKIFSTWILEYYGQGRVLTKKLAEEVCYRLRKKLGLVSLKDPEETKRMHLLLKAARKRQIGKGRERTESKAMSSMDNLETIPMFATDCDYKIFEDRLYVTYLFKGTEKMWMLSLLFRKMWLHLFPHLQESRAAGAIYQIQP